MSTFYETIYDSGTADFTFSLCKQKYIEVEGEKVPVGENTRLGVVPGDFDAVQEFAPELLPVFEAVWTPEVVARYRDKTGHGPPYVHDN